MTNTITKHFNDFNEYKNTKLEIELAPLSNNEKYVSNLEDHILDYIKVELFIPNTIKNIKPDKILTANDNVLCKYTRIYYTKYFTEHIKIFENMYDSEYITKLQIDKKNIIRIPLYYFNLNFLRKIKNQQSYIINVEVSIANENKFIINENN